MTDNTKRKPGLAVIASLLMPGLGQIYNGQVVKGLVLFLVIATTIPLSAWLADIGSKHTMLLTLFVFELIAIGLYLYSIFDAGRTARRLPQGFSMKAMNRSYIYIFAVILGSAILVLLMQFRMQHLVQVVKVPAGSMLPNIMPGEYLLVDKRINCTGCKSKLQHGQLVVFHFPDDASRLSIRRIIGLPGDRIVIKDRQITVNDVPTRSIQITQFDHAELNELFTDHSAWREKNDKAVYNVIWKNNGKAQDISITVPDGKVYVLGDNRDNAVDSRSYGSIPLDAIIGVAEQVGFSVSHSHGIRWWRAGKVIDAIY